ncbi:hypothetical protein PIB30_037555 [Stylosanthes scabra]|uniref:Uncharacterized protein n=1 Tax=Stylosanthes scabra TaxID=79078 RepID=A0ABU6SE23_9FABA|nr:hypothetical protein [Stylosanthes scabra]
MDSCMSLYASGKPYPVKRASDNVGLQMRMGVLFFEYLVVHLGRARFRIYGFYECQFTFPFLSPYFDSDAPYHIPLSSLHPWMPPPPPAPPAEVFEENDEEMA